MIWGMSGPRKIQTPVMGKTPFSLSFRMAITPKAYLRT